MKQIFKLEDHEDERTVFVINQLDSRYCTGEACIISAAVKDHTACLDSAAVARLRAALKPYDPTEADELRNPAALDAARALCTEAGWDMPDATVLATYGAVLLASERGEAGY